jgi:hypothetical protein
MNFGHEESPKAKSSLQHYVSPIKQGDKGLPSVAITPTRFFRRDEAVKIESNLLNFN